MIHPYPAPVLAEGHIQLPVQMILHRPLASDIPRQFCRRSFRKARDIKTSLHAGLARKLAIVFHPSFQQNESLDHGPLPACLRLKLFGRTAIPALSNLTASVFFLRPLMVLHRCANSLLLIQCQIEHDRFNIPSQSLPVIHHPQDIIASLPDELLDDIPLRVNTVTGCDRHFRIEEAEIRSDHDPIYSVKL